MKCYTDPIVIFRSFIHNWLKSVPTQLINNWLQADMSKEFRMVWMTRKSSGLPDVFTPVALSADEAEALTSALYKIIVPKKISCFEKTHKPDTIPPCYIRNVNLTFILLTLKM